MGRSLLRRCVTSLAAFLLLAPAPGQAKPVVVEKGWSLIRTVSFSGAQSARFSPKGSDIFVGRRGTSSDGLYSVDVHGLESKLAPGYNVAALVVASNGDVFFSEDYGGVIYKVTYGKTGRVSWASGFHGGDDDPVGMAITPKNHVGPMLKPGEALMVDRGYSGPDEIWKWYSGKAGYTTVVHKDNGTLVNAVDVVISSGLIYVIDSRESSPGRIYTVGLGGTLAQMTTTGVALADPLGATLDPKTGDLLVADAKGARVLRVDDWTSKVTEVITGLTIPGDGWAGIDHHPDGLRLLVTAKDAVYVFARCAVSPAGGAKDCDFNGKLDACDLAKGTHKDCNDNGKPDVCDIAAATSTDCDNDKVPDDCPACPPVEAVFVMDTSGSMDDEAAALCSKIKAITTILKGMGITLSSSTLGIAATPGGSYSCLTSTAIKLFGTKVPGNPPTTVDTLGKCPGGIQLNTEDWGRATAVIAGVKKWGPKNVRVVIPISDEGPWCGDPVTDPGVDRDSITHAIKVAAANKVMVSPITGTGSSAGVIKLAGDLAKGTGGKTLSSKKPQNDMAKSVLDIINTACKKFSDCNKNGTPDACDISKKKSKDCDFNGVPDECQSPKPACAKPDMGVPDMSVPDAAVPDLPLPDQLPPDAPAPDTKDTPPPDLTLPDAPLPDKPLPDAPVPDKAAPDTKDTPPADLPAADAGVPDAAVPDAPAPDTKDTPPADVSSYVDTLAAGDGPQDDGGGCDCSVVPGVGPFPVWLLILVLFALGRRRR